MLKSLETKIKASCGQGRGAMGRMIAAAIDQAPENWNDEMVLRTVSIPSEIIEKFDRIVSKTGLRPHVVIAELITRHLRQVAKMSAKFEITKLATGEIRVRCYDDEQVFDGSATGKEKYLKQVKEWACQNYNEAIEQGEMDQEAVNSDPV